MITIALSHCVEARTLERRVARANLFVFTAVLLGLLLAPLTAAAISMRLSTGNVDPGKALARGAADPSVTWNYTGDFNDARFLSYVDNDPVFPGATTFVTCHFLTGNCRTNNNSQYGADVAAGYPSYAGVQFFYLSFVLPAGAINVNLDIALVGADDRVGLSLNGSDIAFWGNVDNGGTGRMDGSDKYAATSIGAGVVPTRPSGVTFLDPFPFTPPFSPFVLDDPSQFLLGDINVIRLWVNNTGVRNLSALSNPMSSGNPSVVAFDGTLSYDIAAVPEPWSAALVAMAVIALRRRRR